MQVEQKETVLEEFLEETVASRVLSFAWSAKNRPEISDISLVTHASVKKLDRLVVQLQVWTGPVSVAIYLRTRDDIQQLSACISQHPDAFRRTTVHVLLEPNRSGYPINILRNIATNFAETDYILALDVDFIPDGNCYVDLSNLLQRLKPQLEARTLFVLPAFERFETTGNPLRRSDLPETKQQLLEMVRTGQVAPFHAHFKPGHTATDYQRWYTLPLTAETAYFIKYEARFEPYVLAYRHGLAQYWENFRGFGFNKGSWVMQMHYQGYKFAVLPNHFVVHMNHPGGGDGRFPDGEIIREWHNFKHFLFQMYQAPKAELVDYFGFGDYTY